MPTRDLIDNITTILTWPDLDGQPSDVHGDILAHAEAEQADLAEGLRLARDEGGEDPLVVPTARPRKHGPACSMAGPPVPRRS